MAEASGSRLPPLSAKSSIDELTQGIKQLSTRRREISEDLEKRTKAVGSKLSGDAEWWGKMRNVSEGQIEELENQMETKRLQSFAKKRSEEAWMSSEERIGIVAKIRNVRMMLRAAKRQIQKRRKNPRPVMNWFVNLFITSPLGWDIKPTIFGGRSSKAQSRFRADLIEMQSPVQQAPTNNTIWEPILGMWIEETDIRAAHIFEAKFGEDAIEMIFGKQSKGELFSPANGLLLHHRVETEFDLGYFVIIPNLPRNASDERKLQWGKQPVKDYKIQILYKPEANKKPEDYNRGDWRYKWGKLVYGDILWRDLDGKVLTFQNENRPRARYLWWRYLRAIEIVRSKEGKYGSVIQEVAGKPYWGSTGPYVRKGMIKAFIEHVGQEFAHSLDGAEDQSDPSVEGSSFTEIEEDTLAMTAVSSATASILKYYLE